MSYTPLWGTSHSIFSVVSVKKTELDQFLTSDLDYSDTGLSPADEHPVIYMFNKQKIRILLPFFIMNYYEMIPLIPYVHFKNDPTKNYQTSPILYVSNWLIIIGARILWHLNKVYGKFYFNPNLLNFKEVKHQSIKVFRKDIDSINQVSNIVGETGKPTDFSNVVTLTPLLTTDALIVSYANGNSPNKYWTTAYQFNMDVVQPCNSDLDVLNVEGLDSKNYKIESILKSVFGSFRVVFQWKLPWPRRYNP